jgi:uncharacterized membrane protein YeaQ/YmgE (transglycosylase-associated protein family)
MHILSMLIVGFFVGLFARWLTPGEDRMGFFMTALLGIGGSFAANYGGQALHINLQGIVAHFVASVIGAMVLLVVAHMFRRMMR